MFRLCVLTFLIILFTSCSEREDMGAYELYLKAEKYSQKGKINKAKLLYERACNKGNPDACASFAVYESMQGNHYGQEDALRKACLELGGKIEYCKRLLSIIQANQSKRAMIADVEEKLCYNLADKEAHDYCHSFAESAYEIGDFTRAGQGYFKCCAMVGINKGYCCMALRELLKGGRW